MPEAAGRDIGMRCWVCQYSKRLGHRYAALALSVSEGLDPARYEMLVCWCLRKWGLAPSTMCWICLCLRRPGLAQVGGTGSVGLSEEMGPGTRYEPPGLSEEEAARPGAGMRRWVYRRRRPGLAQVRGAPGLSVSEETGPAMVRSPVGSCGSDRSHA